MNGILIINKANFVYIAKTYDNSDFYVSTKSWKENVIHDDRGNISKQGGIYNL